MQPGYPGSGQDPYGQQQPYVDPYAQPQYSPQQPQPPQQPQEEKPQEEQPPTPPQYQDPYPQPTSDGSYPPPPPGYPGFAPYPTAGYDPSMGVPPQQSNNLGMIAMILGIISIPIMCVPYAGGPISFIAAVAAIVLGILGIRKASAGQATNRGQALTGLICGAVALVLMIGAVILVVALHLNNLPTST